MQVLSIAKNHTNHKFRLDVISLCRLCVINEITLILVASHFIIFILGQINTQDLGYISSYIYTIPDTYTKEELYIYIHI